MHNSEFPPMYAHVAQLGERQTEDLKVLGSIPSVGSTALVAQFGRAWVEFKVIIHRFVKFLLKFIIFAQINSSFGSF